MSTDSVISSARRLRRANIVIAALNSAVLLMQVLVFHSAFGFALNSIALLISGSLIFVNARRIRSRSHELRRPDYAAIARMEKAEYGKVLSTYADGKTLIPDPGGIRMTSVGPVGPVRACCGTTPGTGHRATCARSLMNGGTDADVAVLGQFPTAGRSGLAAAQWVMARGDFYCRHCGKRPRRL